MDMKDALRGRDCIPDYVDTLDGFRALGVLLVVSAIGRFFILR